MHSYAVDTKERAWTAVALAAIAVLIAAGVSSLLAKLSITVPWYIGAPTPVGVFGVLFFIFDRWGWLFAARAHLSRLPDLRGTWTGVVCRREGNTVDKSVTVYIRQTWQHISIELKSGSSTSRSTMASIDLAGRAHTCITYAYSNVPHPGSDVDMHAHMGTATVELSIDGRTLAGDYYTGRDRHSVGTIQLHLDDRAIRDSPGGKDTKVVALTENQRGA
jgi:SMODS-associating 2TM, beta-strand rich effector domain